MFREVKAEEAQLNPFEKIGKDWMLVTAGPVDHCNTMTASWGGLGTIWGKDVATAYIRPQRYTKEFVDREELFTLSFFNASYRNALNLCGTVSGRDRDKITEAGLTPYEVDGTTAFEEADLILVCKKMYQQEMKPECFIDPEADSKWYPEKDYHIMYIAEICKVLVKE